MSDENQEISDDSDFNSTGGDADVTISTGPDDTMSEDGQQIAVEASDQASSDIKVDDKKEVGTAPGMDTPENTDIPAAPEPPANMTPQGGNVMSIKKIQGIKVKVQVVLGSISLSVSQLAGLKKGELVALDSSIGDPIDIYANGQLIARGEIVVIEDEDPKFGVTLSEIVDSEFIS